MYDESIERMIQQSLRDGVLTKTEEKQLWKAAKAVDSKLRKKQFLSDIRERCFVKKAQLDKEGEAFIRNLTYKIDNVKVDTLTGILKNKNLKVDKRTKEAKEFIEDIKYEDRSSTRDLKTKILLNAQPTTASESVAYIRFLLRKKCFKTGIDQLGNALYKYPNDERFKQIEKELSVYKRGLFFKCIIPACFCSIIMGFFTIYIIFNWGDSSIWWKIFIWYVWMIPVSLTFVPLSIYLTIFNEDKSSSALWR